MAKKSEQKVARVLYMIVLSLAFLIFVSPFAIPVIFSASVSLALFPFLLMLEKRGFSRKLSAAILTVLFTILISLPFSFFLVKGTIAVTGQLEKIHFNEALKDQGMQGLVSDVRHDLVLFVHKHAAKLHLEDLLTPKKVDAYLNMVTTFLLKFFQSVVGSLPVVFLFLLVMILCTYSLLKNAHVVRIFFRKSLGSQTKL